MDVYVRVKAIGKRRELLAPTPYVIPEGIGSLRKLLETVVRAEVEQYNSKEPQAQLVPFLTPEVLDAQAHAGKVGFGTVYDHRKADADKAVEGTLQCWEDGLVRVFMDEEEVADLDAPLMVREGAVFTFLRLTFLSGRMW